MPMSSIFNKSLHYEPKCNLAQKACYLFTDSYNGEFFLLQLLSE